VEEGHTTITERMAWKAWKLASLHRKVMNMANGTVKNKVVNSMFSSWTKNRGPLKFS